MRAEVPRVLVADDQTDVLEALRLLLKTEEFAVETATSPAAALAAAVAREFDAVLIDLNYTRDTTSGEEGLDLLSRLVRPRRHAAGGGDDGVGHRRPRGRGDASRRPRLRPEAVGQRAPAGDPAHAGRAVARAPPRAAARGGEPGAARRRRRRADRRRSRDAAGAGPDRARRPVGRQRADHRRARHRQGRGGAPPCTRCRRAPSGRWSPSTSAASPRGCSRASCSAT